MNNYMISGVLFLITIACFVVVYVLFKRHTYSNVDCLAKLLEMQTSTLKEGDDCAIQDPDDKNLCYKGVMKDGKCHKGLDIPVGIALLAGLGSLIASIVFLVMGLRKK